MGLGHDRGALARCTITFEDCWLYVLSHPWLIEAIPEDGNMTLFDLHIDDTKEHGESRVQGNLRRVLPCWRWADASCSLDAVLLMVLQVHQNLPDVMAVMPETGLDQVFYQFRAAVAGWRKDRAWEMFPQDSMQRIRDSIRNLLKDSKLRGKAPVVTISHRSSIDDTLPLLLPSILTTLKVEITMQCSAPNCVEFHRENNAVQIKASRVMNADALHVDGQWQKGSSTQEVIDRLVIPISALLIV